METLLAVIRIEVSRMRERYGHQEEGEREIGLGG